jgi:centrin-3
LRALGFEYKKPEILKMLKEHDKSNTNRIEFSEFNKLSNQQVSSDPM